MPEKLLSWVVKGGKIDGIETYLDEIAKQRVTPDFLSMSPYSSKQFYFRLLRMKN